MLLDIASMRSQARKLLLTDHNYNTLLQFIIDMDYYYNEDLHLPTLKELSTLIGIKYSSLRKQIQQIYMDLLVGSDDGPTKFSFTDILYCFFIKGHGKDKHVYFEADKLPFIPRIGEEFDTPFFKAYLNVTWFHVDSIRHCLTDKGQEVHISLTPGRFNLYWQYRKDKAEEEGELGLRDFWELDDWELKKKLRIGPNNNRLYSD